MTSSMAELLKRAYADKGRELPSASTKAKAHAPEPPATAAQAAVAQQQRTTPASPPNPKGGEIQAAIKSWRAKHPSHKRRTGKPRPEPAPDLSCYGAPPRPSATPSASSSIQLQIGGSAKLLLEEQQQTDPPLLDEYDAVGSSSQCCTSAEVNDERLIVLGLDFGTSSAKVVIGDPALGKAFAVPFREASDIDRYLLPTRLYETNGRFSLRSGTRTHRDLKLSLIADPQNPELRLRAVAFISLVIRHVRGWLFREHGDIYRSTRLLWKLSIGLPVAYHLDDDLHRAFSELGQTAWLAAGNQGPVNGKAIRAAEQRQQIFRDAPEQATADEDIDVSIIPEIAAQIYGFVNSSRFNRRDQNIYLMVDVGAGSVDSSLFHVKPARGGKWDFEFFTSVVEPHGVMNLHRHRVRWWEDALASHPRGEPLANQLKTWKFATDRTSAIPETFASYFKGVSLKLSKPEDGPDEAFFRFKVVQQVRGKSYWRAWNDGLLTQAQLLGVPAFYCGGGIRLPYYQRLQKEMQAMPGCSWLRALPKRVELPSNLVAPGLKRQNFDRLTVAYGLSFLEVGKVTKSLPPPRLTPKSDSSWRENYVGKDCC